MRFPTSNPSIGPKEITTPHSVLRAHKIDQEMKLKTILCYYASRANSAI